MVFNLYNLFILFILCLDCVEFITYLYFCIILPNFLHTSELHCVTWNASRNMPFHVVQEVNSALLLHNCTTSLLRPGKSQHYFVDKNRIVFAYFSYYTRLYNITQEAGAAFAQRQNDFTMSWVIALYIKMCVWYW